MVKKIICCVCILMLALSFTAINAETVESNGKYTTSGTDAASAGKEVVLIILNKDAADITEDSIQYIDQVTADENGYYEFSDYLTKETQTQTGQFKALVGGEAISEPKTEEVPIITVESGIVSGTVRFTGIEGGKKATVKLTNVNDASKVYTALVEFNKSKGGGDFKITGIVNGTYKVEAEKFAHLAYVKNNVLMSIDSVTIDIVMFAGDTNGDGEINLYDITAVVPHVGKKSSDVGFESMPDVNEDGYINLYDITAIVTNVGTRQEK